MKMEDPTKNRPLSGTTAPNRSNNLVVHAGKAMSMAIAMPPPTIVPISLGIRLFMECCRTIELTHAGPKDADREAELSGHPALCAVILLGVWLMSWKSCPEKECQ